jgi:hypothetical protein
MRGEGGSCGVSANEYSCAHHVTWSPNKLCRSTSILNLCNKRCISVLWLRGTGLGVSQKITGDPRWLWSELGWGGGGGGQGVLLLVKSPRPIQNQRGEGPHPHHSTPPTTANLQGQPAKNFAKFFCVEQGMHAVL